MWSHRAESNTLQTHHGHPCEPLNAASSSCFAQWLFLLDGAESIQGKMCYQAPTGKFLKNPSLNEVDLLPDVGFLVNWKITMFMSISSFLQRRQSVQISSGAKWNLICLFIKWTKVRIEPLVSAKPGQIHDIFGVTFISKFCFNWV